MPLDLAGKRIWVAGHRGMVGASVVRVLEKEGCEILTVSKQDCDLRRQEAVESWMRDHAPELVIIAAAKVGGIGANKAYPAEFLYDNMMIEANIIHTAHKIGVEKLLFLGSSCIYPKFAEQPIKEEALLSAPLEPTNEAYAVAKIAGIKLCQAYRAQYGDNFISAMPCNLYGRGDMYDTENSHVIPAMIMKFHQAKLNKAAVVTLWGSGTPLREFLYVDDLADGLVHLLKNYSDEKHINIGSGREVSIKELAELVSVAVGYQGEVKFDTSKPDGTPRKLMDNSRIRNFGWAPKTELREGLSLAYEDFLLRHKVSNAA